MEKNDFWKNKVVNKLFCFWPDVKMTIWFLKQKVGLPNQHRPPCSYAVTLLSTWRHDFLRETREMPEKNQFLECSQNAPEEILPKTIEIVPKYLKTYCMQCHQSAARTIASNWHWRHTDGFIFPNFSVVRATKRTMLSKCRQLFGFYRMKWRIYCLGISPYYQASSSILKFKFKFI